jgi:hypothetical protein
VEAPIIGKVGEDDSDDRHRCCQGPPGYGWTKQQRTLNFISIFKAFKEQACKYALTIVMDMELRVLLFYSIYNIFTIPLNLLAPKLSTVKKHIFKRVTKLCFKYYFFLFFTRLIKNLSEKGFSLTAQYDS